MPSYPRTVTGRWYPYNADVDSDPMYIGCKDKDSYWYIMKYDESGETIGYVGGKGDTSYSTAWTNRASESYGAFPHD
jgi:hypothetical protein